MDKNCLSIWMVTVYYTPIILSILDTMEGEEEENNRERESSEDENESECRICGRKKGELNDSNWNKHIKACLDKQTNKESKWKEKEERKEQRKETNLKRKKMDTAGSALMTKFFRPVVPNPTPVTTTSTTTTTATTTVNPTPLAATSAQPVMITDAPITDTDTDIDVNVQKYTEMQDEDEEVSQSTDDEELVLVKDVIAVEDLSLDIPIVIRDVMNEMIDQITCKSFTKCRGFEPLIDNIHAQLAPQPLYDLNIVVEHKTLHHVSCYENSYQLLPGNHLANQSCSDLKYSPRLTKHIERGQKIYNDDLRSTKHGFLTHQQLSEKAKKVQEEKRTLRLQLMKSRFKCSKLCATLSIHDRFLVSIAEHNIPRLQQLVTVALKNNRSITYIVTKITEVIDGIYMANPSQEDKDLAFLVLKFGGPSLLEILFKAGALPSVSLAYKMSKNCPPIMSSVKVSVGECFSNNISVSDLGKCLVSLKMDETFVTPSMGYHQKDNQAYGCCYQHGSQMKLELETFEDCEAIESAITEGTLHIPKECLVAGVLSLNENKPFQPMLMWPTCSKKEEGGIERIVVETNNQMKESYGYPLTNMCTDGDAARRQLMTRLMKEVVDEKYSWFRHIADLPLVDYLAGPDGMTTNYDSKHIAKRCWRMVLSEKIVIDGVCILKNILKQLFDGNEYGLKDESLYPKDKQNVQSATTFLLAFIDAVTQDELPYNITHIKRDLQLLGQVFIGLLSFYVYTEHSISEQLKSISTASYLLYYLYNEHKTKIIPTQLFHDLQATFQDALFCCAKAKEYCPTEPLFLVLDGTDPTERYFGNVRMRFKGGNYSTLEMINASRSMTECDRILMEHPDWCKKSRLQRRLALDYSNPATWRRDMLTLENVNIEAVWKSGYYRALSMIPENSVGEIEDASTTLRCPIKRGTVVGVKNTEKDWSLDDDDDDADDVTNENEELQEADVNLAEIIPDPNQKADPFFIIDGKKVYKSTCLKSISSAQKLSKDRLRRVQGMSYSPAGSTAALDPDSLLLNGDPVLIQKDGQPRIANVVTISKQNETMSAIDLTRNDEELKNVELTLQFIDTELIDGCLYWTGTTSGDRFKRVGNDCLPIRPSVSLNPPDGLSKYYFDMNLMRDMGVHLQLSNTEATSDQQPHTSGQSVVKKKCFTCRKMIPWSDLRNHVAIHILKHEIVGSNICGFCGRVDSCVVTLKASSKKGATHIYTLDNTDCVHKFAYSRSRKFNKKTNQCTNRVGRCPIDNCLSNVWKYNFETHFEEKHGGIGEYPDEWNISAQEKAYLLK